MATKRKTPSKTVTTLDNEVQDAQAQAQPQATVIQPGVADLKTRFSAGKIPKGGDFESLIEVADVGRRAVGRSPDQPTAGTGAGLELDPDEKLKVKLAATNPGLNITDGVQVGQGAGITVAGDIVAVKGNTAKAIVVDAAGVGVNTGDGLKMDGDAIAAAINTGSLRYDANRNLDVNYNYVVDTNKYSKGLWTFSVGPSDAQRPVLGVNMSGTGGLHIANELNGQIGIKLQDTSEKSGLKLSANGLAIHAGAGLSIGDDGKLNAAVTSTGFAIGMIVMFAGPPANIPAGWALCDGATGSGTPDLRDRFVMGGTAARAPSNSETNNKKFSGDNNAKSFSVSTVSSTPNIRVTMNPVTLGVANLPAHQHTGGLSYTNHPNHPNPAAYGVVTENFTTRGKVLVDALHTDSFNGGTLLKYKSETIGSNSPFTPTTESVTGGDQSHTASISPPYYILAFIMKVR